MVRTASGAFVARGAVVTGDVELGEDASVWFGCVVRGDDAPIRIGPRTNLQDGCIVHCDTGAPQTIGADCTIGHGAIVHGVEIGDGVLIGMGAVILGGARIGAGAVIAAGAVVKENAEVPPRALMAGVPARFVREVSEKEVAFMRHSIPHYIETARGYLAAEPE
ncbi:MAG: gamma carbonic anhydrase family protein [Planctomycetota bacterium]|nr:MAG: gamma carbonic anhydrase family protein [Planctomycetota bacterium]